MPTLDWIGKNAVVEHHKEVPFHLLRCNPDLSVGDPGSGNLLIQGDNLLALKALLPYYAGKVKCIYIDPPYNTGKENWVYNDNVNSPEIREWLGQVVGKEAEDLSRHDKWLCMMYPRLVLLRSFLTPDGIVFVSIGKDEIGHLRVLLDEIFNPRNLIEVLVWNTEGHTENQEQITTVHEYILAYARRADAYRLKNIIDPNVPVDSKIRRSFAENSITKNTPKNPASEINLPVGFPCEAESLILKRYEKFSEFQSAVNQNNNCISRQITREFQTKYPVRIDDMVVHNFALVQPCRVYTGWSSKNKLERFIENGCLPFDDDGTLLSFYLSKNGVIYYRREERTSMYIQSVLRNMGTTEKTSYMLESMGIDFPYPKPIELIEYLIRMVTDAGDIVLDSFLGSGTTAHAVLSTNTNLNNGARRFIGIEWDKDICQNTTYKRLRNVIEGYRAVSGQSKGKDVRGLDGGFRYCTLDAPLFGADGQIRPEVTFGELARHIFFTETGEPLLPAGHESESPLLGVANGRAVYLLFNGILGDTSETGGNVLTRQILANLPPHEGPKVIYGEGCLLSSTVLHKMEIAFRQLPYEVRIS